MSTNKKQIKKELKKVSKIISKLSNKKMKSNQENLFVVLNGIKEMKNVFKYILKQKNDSKTTQEVQKDLVDA
jgi:hypothetical protein